MVTPEVLRQDTMKLLALADAFEHSYLHFLDIGYDQMEERDKGAFAFYGLRDLLQKVVNDAEELCGHMEVCNAVFAVNMINRGGYENGK